MVKYFWQCWDSNRESQVSEATAVATAPQQRTTLSKISPSVATLTTWSPFLHRFHFKASQRFSFNQPLNASESEWVGTVRATP